MRSLVSQVVVVLLRTVLVMQDLFKYFLHRRLIVFTLQPCEFDGCRNPAALHTAYCYQHAPDPENLRMELRTLLQNQDEIGDLCIQHAEFDDLILGGKQFYACSFSHGVFTNVDFSTSSFRLCFFDFCRFDGCAFRNTDMKYSVFAGSQINNCDFSSSDILHCNFNGIHAQNSSFTESDLYFSCFSQSELKRTSFVDCNLKKVRFNGSRRADVTFKYSNYEAADFGED